MKSMDGHLNLRLVYTVYTEPGSTPKLASFLNWEHEQLLVHLTCTAQLYRDLAPRWRAVAARFYGVYTRNDGGNGVANLLRAAKRVWILIEAASQSRRTPTRTGLEA